ncbi:hypothetical protein KQI63_05910 [bacterium]|nr:hypothetical protein [bacterium]
MERYINSCLNPALIAATLRELGAIGAGQAVPSKDVIASLHHGGTKANATHLSAGIAASRHPERAVQHPDQVILFNTQGIYLLSSNPVRALYDLECWREAVVAKLEPLQMQHKTADLLAEQLGNGFEEEVA